MRRRTFFSTLPIVMAAAAYKPATIPGQRRPQRSKDLDFELMLAVTEVPAIAVAGVINGTPFERVAGVRSVIDKTLVTPNTYFPAASLSKPVFAWAVRDLVRKRKLDWDKPLQDYVDLGLSGNARWITAEHVLTHSSGLPNWRFQLDKPLTLDFVPGSKWQYSGEGIVLLQRVVEKIVGVPIATYMKESVLYPFGMRSSTFAWSPVLQANAVNGHDRRANPLERSMVFYERRNFDLTRKAGLNPASASYAQIVSAYEKAKTPALPVAIAPNMAGSLWTSAREYAMFLKRVLADTAANAGDYRERVQVNPRIAWTRGWGVDRTFRRPALFHWGDGPGFKNFAWVEPEKQTALVFLTNGDHGYQLYSAVFRQLLAEDPASLWWL
ncbi:MAG: serine hydrolase domain-containing protein [Acidobacteriota bacterium]